MLVSKRLEQGTFRWPTMSDGGAATCHQGAAPPSLRPPFRTARSRSTGACAGRLGADAGGGDSRSGAGRQDSGEAGRGAQAADQSRRAAAAFAARRDRGRRRGQDLRLLRRPQASHRRRCLRTARRHPGSVQGDRDAPPQIRLCGLRRRSRAGAGAGAADRERHSDRGALAWPSPDHALYSPGANRASYLDRSAINPGSVASETTAPVLDPGRGCTKKGQLWAYARDGNLGLPGRAAGRVVKANR